MAVRLLPWAPEYGTSMLYDPDAEAPRVEVDTRVEQGRWLPVAPSGSRARVIQVVDGVRRVEAHALADGPQGEPLFGLFGSYAVGAVRCEEPHGRGGAGSARVLDETVDVQRRYLQAGGEPEDHTFEVGGHPLRFVAERRPETSANGLIDALNRLMLDAEALLAERLGAEDDALTLVDGPLRHLRMPGRRVVGYVKRVVHWYVTPEEQRLLLALETGQRTPLFLVGEQADEGAPGRYCWYLRVAELGPNFHPLGGVMRLEAPGALPLAQAVDLADRASLALPRLASASAHDPRAPQNLVPVGALESVLTHRLGEREWVRRLLTAYLGARLATARAAREAGVHA